MFCFALMVLAVCGNFSSEAQQKGMLSVCVCYAMHVYVGFVHEICMHMFECVCHMIILHIFVDITRGYMLTQ